jgi:hypothetical protein
VLESQNAFSDPKVACSIAYIRSKFGWRLESVKRLETQEIPLQESMDTIKNASEKLSAVKEDVGVSVSTKLQAMLKGNPGFSTITSACQVCNGDDVDPAEDIAPEEIPFLKYAPVTSSDVERLFSAKNTFYETKDNQCPQKIWEIF